MGWHVIATQRDAPRRMRVSPLLGACDGGGGRGRGRAEGPFHADKLALSRLAPRKFREDGVQRGVACEWKVWKLAAAAAVRGAHIELAGASGGADADLRQPRRPTSQLRCQKIHPRRDEGRRAQRRQQAVRSGRPMLQRWAPGRLGALVRAREEARQLIGFAAIGDELGGEANLAACSEAERPKPLVEARIGQQLLQQRRRRRRLLQWWQRRRRLTHVGGRQHAFWRVPVAECLWQMPVAECLWRVPVAKDAVLEQPSASGFSLWVRHDIDVRKRLCRVGKI